MFVYKHYLNDIMIASLDGQTYSNGNTISFDYLKKQSWFAEITNPSGEIAFIQRIIILPIHMYVRTMTIGLCPLRVR